MSFDGLRPQSVDIRMHPKKSRKRSTSMHDEELERAQERIRTIEMISLLREEKLKVEFKNKERLLRNREI